MMVEIPKARGWKGVAKWKLCFPNGVDLQDNGYNHVSGPLGADSDPWNASLVTGECALKRKVWVR